MGWFILFIAICILEFILLDRLCWYLDNHGSKRKRKTDTVYVDLQKQHQQRIEKYKQQSQQEIEKLNAEHKQRIVECREQAQYERTIETGMVESREQYQQSQYTAPVEDTIQELSKNEIMFLANKQTAELLNMISNIVHSMDIQQKEESGSNVQTVVLNNSVQDYVSVHTGVQSDTRDEQPNVVSKANDIDLNQYHTYNNEYNKPTYKKPSPIVGIDKDSAYNTEYAQYEQIDTPPDIVSPVIDKTTQNNVNQNTHNLDADSSIDTEERLRIKRNKSYLAHNKKLTICGRYNLYVNQLVNKHNQYIDLRVRINRTIRLAKDAGLTDEVIDDILNTGDGDKYLIRGVDEYE